MVPTHCFCASCRREVEVAWAFCPYCGADNRALENRVPVSDHRHGYVDGQPHCVFCGKMLEAAEAEARGSLPTLGCLISIIGFLFVSAGLTFPTLAFHTRGPASRWVLSWWSKLVLEDSPRHPALNLGTLVSGGLFLAGSLIIIYGLTVRYNIDMDWSLPHRGDWDRSDKF